MTADMSFFEMVFNASWVVKVVMLLLLGASLISWFVIFNKWSLTRTTRRAADDFEKQFWSGKELSQVYSQVATPGRALGGMEAIFDAGYKGYARLHKQPGMEPRAVMDGVQRGMRVALSREVEQLEAQLPFLATVGSVSPYVGLFGTVWGIMNSFRGLGNVHQATLAMVAPGIAEALIATAMGLFAAIPAVVAYNRYVNETDRLINRYNNFMEEFSGILQRQVYRSGSE